jgi:hypothetical protein
VTVIGDVVLRLSTGAASQAVLTLPVNRHDSLDGDWGVFVQDRWTVKRLTANFGLRMDQLQTSVPDQVLPASIWLSEQHFTGRDVLNRTELSPRLGAAYDLFGNGKTALKVAVARFVDGETVNLTGQVNPRPRSDDRPAGVDRSQSRLHDLQRERHPAGRRARADDQRELRHARDFDAV